MAPRAVAGAGSLTILLRESVASKSGPAFVNTWMRPEQRRRWSFDLFRVGTFTATARPPRVMKLLDPDGNVVASSDDGALAFPISLRTLNASRDAQGKPRPWALDLRTSAPDPDEGTDVWASVVDTARINTTALKQRIDWLIGEDGRNLRIRAEVRGDELRTLLSFTDEVAAGTADMLGLLGGFAHQGGHAHGGHVDLSREYTIAAANRVIEVPDPIPGGAPHELDIRVEQVAVTAIRLGFGPSEHVHASIPAITLELDLSGQATAYDDGVQVARMKLPQIALELAIAHNADGTFSPLLWMPEKIVDVVVLGILKIEYIEAQVNQLVRNACEAAAKTFVAQLPHVLAVLLGDHFTHSSLRCEDDDFLLEYVAPQEPEPKPAPNYVGVIGRTVTEVGPHDWHIKPPSLGDTWAAGNLRDHILHIVVVMMENRSYNHVLGYLATPSGGRDSDGLTDALTGALAARSYPILRLGKTKLDAHVGHSLGDVREQLSKTMDLGGRTILSPEGFVSNFAKQEKNDPGIKLTDVLGYYDDHDLPFFRFLVDNYAWSERYYSSHPGPTLPNRMCRSPETSSTTEPASRS